MLYRGYFYNLKDERYQVEMITERNSGATRSLQLGVPPFVTEMEESDDNLFKPCKYQSATLKVVTTAATDYQFDVYATAPNSTIVRLIAPDASVKWVGFATPNLYNIGFTRENEELEIELIDALSVLQYYKYETQEKTIRSFAEILLTNILPKCELYKHLYVTTQIGRMSDDEEHLTSDIPVLNDLYISEMNFFDEKSENQTDNDVAWTCQEVLEQICQYIGVTLVGDGEDLWMISYDGIIYKDYHKYNIGETGYTEVQITAPTHLISKEDYMGGENNLSMLSVYNKVSVKDSFYTFDSVIPSIYDDLQNITKSYDYDLQDATSAEHGMYGIIMPSATGNQKRDPNHNMIALADKVFNPSGFRFTTPNAIFVKYFKSPHYKTYAYKVSASTSEQFSKLVPYDPIDLNYTETKSYRGAVICKFDVQKLDNDASNIIIVDPETGRIVDTTIPFDLWLALNDISSVNFTNYLAFFNPNDEHHIQNESAYKFPFFETLPNDTTSSFFGGDNCYLLISGKYIWHYFNVDPYPIPTGEEIDITEGRYAIDSGDAYMLAKLQWGDEYWNGSGWTSGETTFHIPYFKEGEDMEERRADHTIFESIDFRNTVSWRFGLSDKGYCIPCPHIMTGALKLTLYKPTDPNYHSARTGDDVGRHYKHSVVFLKDFDIKAVVGDPTYSDVNDTDTKYEATIDAQQDAVSEMDEIEFKICTNDGKAPNYSAVCYKENDEYHYLTKMFAPIYGDSRPEEILIQKLCHQYGTPKIKLQLQLDNNVKPYQVFKNNWVGAYKNFVVDCQSIDYYNNVTTITLVEK